MNLLSRLRNADQSLMGESWNFFQWQAFIHTLNAEQHQIQRRPDRGKQLLRKQKRARDRAENELNRLLDALAEREQSAAAERSSLSEALTRWEAMQTEPEVWHNRKQNLEEEITQGRHQLTDRQTELLRLATNLCRDESVTETARRSVEIQFRRLEIVEKCVEKATQEEASERSRAQVGQN
jgi:chromosome segregation ATPase